MMKKTILLWLIVLSAFSCAKVYEDGSSEAATRSGHQDKMEALQELAVSLPAELEPVSTRSAPKIIAEIIPFKDILSGLASTPAGSVMSAQAQAASAAQSLDEAASAVLDDIYVVNYDLDGGFAILSADSRVPSVIGYSGSGNLTPQSDPNPGLRLTLQRIAPMVEASLRTDSFPTDVRYETVSNQVTGPANPLVTTQWRQGSPFNNNMAYAGCLTTDNERYPAGCVAIALAQLMAYHSHPASVGGVIQPWEAYRYFVGSDDTRAKVAGLLQDIGMKVSMTYTCDGSGSNITNARSALVNSYGYSADNIVPFSFQRIKTDIDASRPLYIRGEGYRGGHAWVVDSYKTRTHVYDVWIDTYDISGNLLYSYKSDTRTKVNDLIHCNWGWNGDSDGYYTSLLFSDDGYSSQDLSANMQLIPNIQKVKQTNRITLSGSVPNWTISATYPVASSLSVTCEAQDTLASFSYYLPAGSISETFTQNNVLIITQISPASDNNYHYTY